MSELTAAASEVRERLADYLDRLDGGNRVVITRNGKEKAYLISIRELRALEETLAVLENTALLENIREGLEDLRAGRVQTAEQVLAEIAAELTDEE